MFCFVVCLDVWVSFLGDCAGLGLCCDCCYVGVLVFRLFVLRVLVVLFDLLVGFILLV